MEESCMMRGSHQICIREGMASSWDLLSCMDFRIYLSMALNRL